MIIVKPKDLFRNCAILVNSCDGYEDVWPLFFSALKDNWENCDLQIYLNTEKKVFHFDGLRLNLINSYAESGKDQPWGGRLIETLKAINKEYIINLFDDFVLEQKVDIEKIAKCITAMINNKQIAVFYFSNIPGINLEDKLHDGFELIGARNDYRLNSAPALWRREKLIEFTGEIDSPWAWEFFGSARTFGKKDLFYCAKKNEENIFVYNYALGGAIRRGRWVESVARPLIEKYNLKIDLKVRGCASESLSEGKYSLGWKINFFLIGFRMIGLKIFIFIFRIFKKKILNK